MKKHVLLGFAFGVAGAAVALAQAPAPAHVQAPQDPRYADLVAKCKTPPAARGGGPGGAARGGGAAAPGGAPGGAAAAAQGRGPAPAAGPAEYTVAAIPGVIAAGQRWTLVWQAPGNNADGIIAADDGGLLMAQNDNGNVVKIDARGQASTVHANLNTSGALARNAKGALFVNERGFNTAVRQIEPQNRVHADRFQGEPLECIGGVLNDLTADSRGGVYFTMGGLFYADPKGVVTRYGQDLRTNGVILSPDEKTLYVTNQNAIAAFDVQADGSLTNQREFVKLPSGGGDGSAVDSEGRLYVTAGAAVHVIARDGKYLGNIPSPVPLITTAFAGTDKKTLYAVASIVRDGARTAYLYSIPMVAQGYKGRAK